MITNIHVHTPFSFSAFSSIKELVDTAAREQVAVLGINDLNTADGFKEFSAACHDANIFPVFNIELRIENDLSNRFPNDGKPFSPFYTGEFSGKAIPFPHPLPADVHNLIASIWKKSQDRIWKMIEQLNTLLNEKSIPITLDYTIIRSRYARTSVYEQHIASALADYIKKRASSDKQIDKWYESLLGEPSPISPETTIVNKLLNAGKPAYVRMDADLSLTIAQARHLILQAGGIPCYQCRIDTMNTSETPLMDAETLADNLEKRGIFAIEFLPRFCDVKTLRSYMTCLHNRHFCVSIGNGHFSNTDKSTLPVTVDGRPLEADLLEIGFEGACIYAAHQHHRLSKRPGFLDEQGNLTITVENLPGFIADGHAEIKKALNISSARAA